MRDEVKPLVNDAWSKAELPQELIGTHQMQTLIVGKSITGHSAFVG
jgi:glutaryl-CoA dehydrogenase